MPAAESVAEKTVELIEEQVRLRQSNMLDFPELASESELSQVWDWIDQTVERQTELLDCFRLNRVPERTIELGKLIVSRAAEKAKGRARLSLGFARLGSKQKPRAATNSEQDPQPRRRSRAEERLARVNRAIESAKQKGVRLTRTMIWKAARYGDATQFQRWQRDGTGQSASAAQAFERVLNEEPWLDGDS